MMPNVHLDEHQLDEDGEHDPEACELCIEKNDTVLSECRCARCCTALLIEASLRDAEREPLIAEKGKPVHVDIDGNRELIGWTLNGNGAAGVFLDEKTKLCTIYDTRPLCCRLFDCNMYEHRDQD